MLISQNERLRRKEFAWAVGFRLLEARKRRKLEQKEIAELLGISQSAYSRLENGHSIATLYQLARIAKKLEIKVFNLIPDLGEDS